MKTGFRQSMVGVHTWAGLVVGWVLFLVFLTGTAGYFDAEIDRWMQPERPLQRETVSAERAVEEASARLSRAAPGAERWFIGLPGPRDPDMTLFWRADPSAGGGTGRVEIDPTMGAPVAARETGGGQFLYKLHYRLHYMPAVPAYWIVGLCSMLMLIAIVTGIIIHKRIFKDFFTFRPGKGQRSWLDAHNVLSVLALPFHIMITYSGLIFFAYLYMAPVIAATYGMGEEARDVYFDERFERDSIPARTGIPADLTPLAPLVREAERRLGDGMLGYLNIHNPGDANARVVIVGGPATPSRQRTGLTFDGVDGTLLTVSAPDSAPMTTYQTLLGLHEGLFAGPILRWFYFLSGALGTAMVGAGLILWTVKRRARIGGTPGFRLVERLNIGTIAGLPVAIAAYFWANRLIPVGIGARAAWEAHVLFIVWAAMLLHAFLRPARRGWWEQLWLAAAAFGLLPALNAVTTDRHLGVTLPAGAWDLAGVDLVTLVLGLAFAGVAWRLGRRARHEVRAGGRRAESGLRARGSEAAE